MTGKISRLFRSWVVVLFLGTVADGMGQDVLPTRLQEVSPTACSDSLALRKGIKEKLSYTYSLPATFKQVSSNAICDPSCSLFPFWEKLRVMRRPVRVVHIGDSHVRGHVFPWVLRKHMERDFGCEAVYPDSVSYHTSGLARETGKPGIVYHAIGINGATATRFSNAMQIHEIAGLKPDLLILSFGTNESHGGGYRVSEHERQLDELVGMLHQVCPDACFLFTTPPGSYVRYRRKRSVNTRTPLVAKTIFDYALEHGYAVWDLFRIAGGRERACLNWVSGGCMTRDHIHYTRMGYIMQGNLLYDAMVKAYNDYVSD